MKRTYLLFGVVLFFLILIASSTVFATTFGYKWQLEKTDSVLVELLSISYNDPSWTPTIRQDYLKLGAKRVSSVIPICPFKTDLTIGIDTSKKIFTTQNIVDIIYVQRYADTDSAYSLVEIGSNSVGQKEIATSVPARYYWIERAGNNTYIYIYPPSSVSSVALTVYGYYSSDNFVVIRQIAHHIILEYALYRCYLQKGEIDIARAKKEWADIMLYDLKNNLENRPIDIILKKKVLSK